MLTYVFVFSPLVAVVLVALAVNAGQPALRHWRHERCLDRIAVLELACGLHVNEPERLPANAPRLAAANWERALREAADKYATQPVKVGRTPYTEAREAHAREIQRRERAERKSGRGQRFGR